MRKGTKTTVKKTWLIKGFSQVAGGLHSSRWDMYLCRPQGFAMDRGIIRKQRLLILAMGVCPVKRADGTQMASQSACHSSGFITLVGAKVLIGVSRKLEVGVLTHDPFLVLQY